MGARTAGKSLGGLVQARDDRVLAAGLNMADARQHLWAHGARCEVALAVILLHLVDVDRLKGAGVRLPVVEDSSWNVGQNHQNFSTNSRSKSLAGEILVDDSLNSIVSTLAVVDNRDTTTARSDDLKRGTLTAREESLVKNRQEFPGRQERGSFRPQHCEWDQAREQHGANPWQRLASHT